LGGPVCVQCTGTRIQDPRTEICDCIETLALIFEFPDAEIEAFHSVRNEFLRRVAQDLGVRETQVLLYDSDPGSVMVQILILPPVGQLEITRSEMDRIVAAAKALEGRSNSGRSYSGLGVARLVTTRLPNEVAPEEGEEEEEDDSPLLGIGLPSVIAIAVGTGAVLLLGIVVALLIWRRSAKAKMRSVAPDDTTSGKSSAGGSRAALLSSPVAEASEKGRQSSARVHPRDGSPSAQLSRRGAAALPEDAPDS